MNQLLMGATWSDVIGWIGPLSHGFVINLEAAALTLLIGLPAGFLLAVLSQQKPRWIRWPNRVVIELGRGAPALVLIQFFYFGMPQVHLTLGSFSAAIVALSLSTAGYTSEIIRSGLDAVPDGQKEAVQALNLSRGDAMRYVILPQALGISAPALLGFAILVLQSTTLCFTIAMPEIASRAYEIGSTTFQYFPVLALTAAFFIVVCVPASFFGGWLERGDRK